LGVDNTIGYMRGVKEKIPKDEIKKILSKISELNT
jgi:hypothetical protein